MNQMMKMALLGLSLTALTFESAVAKSAFEYEDGEVTSQKVGSKKTAVRRMFVAIDKFDNKAGVEVNQFDTIRTRIQQAVVGTRKFEVLEREQMKNALSEQNLIAAGMVNGDDSDAPGAGRMKAAGYVIYGNVLFYGNDQSRAAAGEAGSLSVRIKVEIQVKITDAETGKILAEKSVVGIGQESRVATTTSRLSGNFTGQCERAAVADAAHYVVDALRDVCYPAKIIRISKNNEEVTVNMTDEEVSEGDVFDVYEVGEEMFDEDTGRSLGTEGDRVGRVAITRTMAKTSVGEVSDYVRKSKKKGVQTIETNIEDLKVGFILRRVSNDTLRQEQHWLKEKNRDAFEAKF